MAYKDLLAQEEVENEGAWLPLSCGGEMKITYFGNPDFLKRLRRLETIYRKKHSLRDNQDLPDGVAEEMTKKAMVGTVCKEIRDVYESEGDAEPLESTEENILMLLESRKIRSAVIRYAKEEETFEEENLEIVSKN